MTSHTMDEIANALRACEDAGMTAEQVGRSIEPYRFTFLMLSGKPGRVAERDKRTIARRLRQALTIWHLEQACEAGRHTGSLTRYG